MQPTGAGTTVDEIIDREKAEVISQTNMHVVGEKLREIVAEDGLGVAILVAWRHGLSIGHIPLDLDETGKPKDVQAEKISHEQCPYVYVRVPVRAIRGDIRELVRRGIMNPKADPVWFIYHEDGLVGTFSFQEADIADLKLSKKDIAYILDVLAQQGALIEANINNRQVQFKAPAARKFIEESGERIYVKAEKSIDWDNIMLPARFDTPRVRSCVRDTLRRKPACNYCSVQALDPNEVTVHSAYVHASAGPRKDVLATVRNYQLGFTYAPFGDPREVCHFLAWDFPHINDLVMNMDPQTYSFSDLIKLVRVINRDVDDFCKKNRSEKGVPSFTPISGVCNHWAGNSIYHQHYQFFRVPGLPLTNASTKAPVLAGYKQVEVLRFDWPAPSYLITPRTSADSTGRRVDDEDVMFVADRVAKEWDALSEGVDKSYGNGIEVADHTQNIFVSIDGDSLKAIFIPRHRKKLNTSDTRNAMQKSNVGALEMMGYFLIDNKEDFCRLREMAEKEPAGLKALGDSWLTEIAPAPKVIEEFEERLRTCLSDPVITYEHQLEEILSTTYEDATHRIWELLASIDAQDEHLNKQQRQYLRQVVNDAWLKKYGEPLLPVKRG
jgi:hypothetical protein